MDDSTRYILDSLKRQTDLITGFIIVQSIALSFQLGGSKTFGDKMTSNSDFAYLTILLHLIIIIGGIYILVVQGKKIKKYMDEKIIKAITPGVGIIVRIVLILIYGLLPILILFRELEHI